MEYIKGKPYFCFSKNKIKQYNYLKKDLNCDILIIGGGVDGAVANFYLSQKYDVALVDKGRLGYACTACATALLEYQLDEFAKDLRNCMSEDEIILSYKMGLDEIKKIDEFIKTYGNYCNFNLRPTFLLTNSIFSVKDMIHEFEFRKNNGFECELITSKNNPFEFPIKAGIYCDNGGCEFNPYLFTKQMIENSNNQNKIFEYTNITQLIKQNGGYLAITNFGEKIYCKKVIVATGFNWGLLNTQNLCDRFITYSIVTEPVKDFGWYNRSLIHDASSPYHYMRLLPDNRIIFGGEDTVFKQKPISEKQSNKKYKKLTKDLFKLFPNLKDNVSIDYKFCGTFGTTKNNLGLIGESGINKDLLLFISCGANGMINAVKGIEIIDDILQNAKNPLTKLISPKRKNV